MYANKYNVIKLQKEMHICESKIDKKYITHIINFGALKKLETSL